MKLLLKTTSARKKLHTDVGSAKKRETDCVNETGSVNEISLTSNAQHLQLRRDTKLC